MSSKKDKAQERAERAAAALAAAKRAQRKRNVRMAIGVVAAMLVIVGGAVAFTALRDDSKNVKASDPGSSGYGMVVGQDGAKHTLIIYEDFLCPICEILESTANERLSQAAADGTVQIDYRPIAFLTRFGPYTHEALNAFFVVQKAAGDEVAKKFHDLLYEDQPSEEGPFPDTDWLVQKAVQAGATEGEIRPGIESDAEKDAVKAATDEAVKAGVTGTPTILLDGKFFNDGSSWEAIANNLVKAIE